MRLRHEPRFELPPQIAVNAERRLSAQLLASWQADWREAALPSAADFDQPWAAETLERTVRLTFSVDGSVDVTTVGAAVAAVFALRTGTLAAGNADLLPSRLAITAAIVRQTLRPAQFEAIFMGAEPRLRVLTRAVMLPLAGAGGALAEAIVVVTWKQALSPAAHQGLQREIDAALTMGASLHRHIDAFATDAQPVTIAGS